MSGENQGLKNIIYINKKGEELRFCEDDFKGFCYLDKLDKTLPHERKHSDKFVKCIGHPYYHVCTLCAEDGYEWTGVAGARLRQKMKYDKLKKIQVKCDCGATVSKANLSKHNKSLKHVKFAEQFQKDHTEIVNTKSTKKIL